MRSRSLPNDLLLSVLVWVALLTPVTRADEMTPEQRQAVQKGLQWLAKTQHKDGHWEASSSAATNYPEVMTAISGCPFLMYDGSVRVVSYSIDATTMQAYLTAQGGDVPPNPLP